VYELRSGEDYTEDQAGDEGDQDDNDDVVCHFSPPTVSELLACESTTDELDCSIAFPYPILRPRPYNHHPMRQERG
jgi:hypothetical protein